MPGRSGAGARLYALLSWPNVRCSVGHVTELKPHRNGPPYTGRGPSTPVPRNVDVKPAARHTVTTCGNTAKRTTGYMASIDAIDNHKMLERRIPNHTGGKHMTQQPNDPWDIGGGGDSFPFDHIGDEIEGYVQEMSTRQGSEIGTSKPAWWDEKHTRPKM